ncbi:hypothetical protein BTO20_25695 [Mycobacterium dioxanotrophicus]|jgi:uncharacterized protein (TIGR02118 family)|uniref:EthD domain-containing protein n=1 Tax=Mycobacterium dioxanotrophicus TaxID=482462 RepID=A0A1Y0C8B8_9MYCO|nr:EthD family reductase [Mycobacterium dioxanotrophicus]ART71490.1 hypothetical protein BTO20_25695 [Mycobacterium dioxanotrophicus]
MHDVIVLYNRPAAPDAFDAYYRDTHIPLVHKLPMLREFSWGKVTDQDSPFYVLARLSYASSEDAAASLTSVPGKAAVDDLANFADAGVTVLNVPRHV